MTGLVALALDAATSTGTVAVLRGSNVIGVSETAMRGADAERLMPAVQIALERAGVAVNEVQHVICGAGPGSFTSLRIAAGIAKGIALVRGRPLFAVSSLLLIAAAAEPPLPPGRYLAQLDAMRGERFIQAVDIGASEGAFGAGVIERLRVEDAVIRASSDRRTPIGPGCELDLRPHASGVARLLATSHASAQVRQVSLASWEPDYGRLAEAQVKWEAANQRPLPSA